MITHRAQQAPVRYLAAVDRPVEVRRLGTFGRARRRQRLVYAARRVLRRRHGARAARRRLRAAVRIVAALGATKDAHDNWALVLRRYDRGSLSHPRGGPVASADLPLVAHDVAQALAHVRVVQAHAAEDARRAHAADPYDHAGLGVYLAAMVELGLKCELFYCAHRLVDAYPKAAVSWFAVGCYYLLVHKSDTAQRYFHRSAKLDPRFAPAWLGFGNAFAAQDESEQAMAAYRSASRLFQGSHLPLLYIGME